MFTLYRIPYLFDYINRPGRLLNIWTLRVGAYSRWAFIRGGDLIYFELGRNFRLEISIGWGEAETENDFSYLFVCFVFVCLFLPGEPEKCSVLSAFS